jgi:hypothetical protein
MGCIQVIEKTIIGAIDSIVTESMDANGASYSPTRPFIDLDEMFREFDRLILFYYGDVNAAIWSRTFRIGNRYRLMFDIPVNSRIDYRYNYE